MFLSNASIRRPVAMCCLLIALTLLGVRAFYRIGLEWLPSVDLPYITIVTAYPGASPAEIETDVAKRLEDAVVSVDGLKHVTSMCMENVCQMLLEFELEYDVDVVANDVREQLDLVTNDLPSDAEDPIVLKFDINALPIVQIALTGDAELDALYDYADNQLRDRLITVPGVADVQIVGGAEREVQVLLDRHRLSGKGLSSVDVVQRIQQGIRRIPAGFVRDSGIEYAVKYDAEYESVQAIEAMEVANEDGQRTYIGDVGRVIMGTEEIRQKAFVDGSQAVGIKIVKKSDANAVDVVERVRREVSELGSVLPGGMELVWVTDSAQFIEASVDDTITNIWQGVVLTALILFFFLYNFRSTLIVAVTMPLTIIIGIYFISFLGYTLNVSTLLAMGLSIGILVTNSIVVIESIVKRLNTSGDPVDAARVGSRTVAVAVIASAGTNLVVLFPVATMGSMVGLFFAPFALTMVIMTIVSLFISFTLTPILASVLLRPAKENRRGPIAWMERVFNAFFGFVTRAFASNLRFFERHRTAAVAALAVVLLLAYGSVRLGAGVGFDFFPQVDRGELMVKLEFPTDYALSRTESRVARIEERVRKLPEIRHVLTTIGKVEASIGRSSEGVYLAQMLLRLSDKTERSLTIDALQDMVRRELENVTECIVTVGMVSGAGGQETPVELVIAGEDLAVLDDLALRVQALAMETEGFLDPDTTVRQGKPEILVRPKRPVLGDLDVPPVGLGLALRTNLEGVEAGIFKQAGRNYDIVVKMEEEPGRGQVRDFQFPGAPAHPVALPAVASIEDSVAPVMITRRNKQRISKLFSGKDGALGDMVEELTRKIEEMGMPPGYTYQFYGEVEMMQEANAAMGDAALIAMLLVYLVLAAILESFVQPFIILITLPLGLVGIVLGLGLTGQNINMFVLLGGIMLIGIVVNNAILIMDQLNQYRQEGVPRHEAMVRAASERFRPIVMITLAAVLGMMPLALATGIGSEMRTAMGIASVGGISVSALLTLLVLPILYDLFTRGNGKKKGDKTEQEGAAE